MRLESSKMSDGEASGDRSLSLPSTWLSIGGQAIALSASSCTLSLAQCGLVLIKILNVDQKASCTSCIWIIIPLTKSRAAESTAPGG